MVSESNIQAKIRLQAARDGVWLMKNSSGALKNANGRMIRFGLGHDSAVVNKQLKSSDLVGIIPLLIEQRHVGMTIGRFVAVEVKGPEFRGSAGGDEHVQAQAAWQELVRQWGGAAGFGSSLESARRIWGGV